MKKNSSGKGDRLYFIDKFKCKAYLFVVDYTCKYKQFIVDTIENKSHFGTNFENIILIK